MGHSKNNGRTLYEFVQIEARNIKQNDYQQKKIIYLVEVFGGIV
jgi:hypothetical protein